jgi:hypothetical protein
MSPTWIGSPARKILIVLALAVLPLAGGLSASGAEMLTGKDPAAKPFLDAIHAVMEPIAAGEADKAEAHFAGDETDLELLRAYIKTVAAEKLMEAALDKKFGADRDRPGPAVKAGVEGWGAGFDYNSIFVRDKHASCSASGPLGVGIEFQQVDGVWKVSSLASRPETAEEHIKRLAVYRPKIEAITAGISNGTVASADDAIGAIEDARELVRQRIAPASDGTSPPPAEAVMRNVHENLSKMAEAVGGLSDEQGARLAALEKGIDARIKADPAMPQGPSFRTDVVKQFREILAADQQTKFDKIMAESAVRGREIHTGLHLKEIGLAAVMYANDHKDQLPPDLGTLVSQSVEPEKFLAAGSKTKVPEGFAALDSARQAAWVNEHTEFVYLGAGKQMSGLGLFVLACPKDAGQSQSFLFADGSVQTFNAEQTARMIAELKAGTNPPTSLPK